jgi:hypothetical protein
MAGKSRVSHIRPNKSAGKPYDLRSVGPRQNVLQIAPPRHLVRSSVASLQAEAPESHELITQPLESPTGPGGASGFRNRAGSQIAIPAVSNVYLGPFWDDQDHLEAFSKAIIENGYLDPLRQLNQGTGPGVYLGPVQGPTLAPGDFLDSQARQTVTDMLDQGILHADANTLFMLILPSGVVSKFDDGAASCNSFCGYHDAFIYHGIDVAYAVMPSAECGGCGGGAIDAFTATYSHEVAEATDKIPGKGWVADDGSENGDLEAWILFPWGPPDEPKRFTVQGYYTNELGNTIGAWRDSVADVPASPPVSPA